MRLANPRLANPRLRLLWAGLALGSVLCAPIVAAARDAIPIGVNAVNLAWQTPDAREEILAGIAAAGVRRVRLTIPGPVEASIDAIRRARAHGLEVLLVLPTDERDYYPRDIQPRPGLGRLNDQFPLSEIDLEAYRASFGALWRALDRPETRLFAVEVGNELNWADFNGDYPVSAAGVPLGPDGSLPASVQARGQRGIVQYARMLQVVRDLRDASTTNRDTRVLSAGLADVEAEWVQKTGGSRMEPRLFMDLLRRQGVDRLVDGYGAHFYPAKAKTAAEIVRQMEATLSYCRDGTRPCTITEWGIHNESPACGADETERAEMARITRDAFARLAGPMRIDGTYFYTWQDASPHSLRRCGRLGETGRAVISERP